jgi:outer membrane protein assembly factor BamB
MNAALSHRPRGTAIVWSIAVLFALSLVLAGFQLYHAHRIRRELNEDLIRELAEATILEEEAAPASAGWPQWRGPKRNSVVHSSDLLTDWPDDGPPVKWQKSLALGYSSFAVKNGRLYSLFKSGAEEVVACWLCEDGKELWRYPYSTASRVDGYPGPRSTPTLDEDSLYTVGSGGKLLCLDAASGSLRWQKELLADFQATAPTYGVAFSPLVDGDLLIANPGGANGNSVAAFNKRTGELVWKSLDEPAGYSSPIAFTIAGTRQIIFFLAKCLVGVRAHDGQLCWRYPWETPQDVNASTPLAFEARRGDHTLHYVFLCSDYGKGCALLKIAATAGGGFEAEQVYRGDQMRSLFASPVRRGEYLYGNSASHFACMNLRTGQVQWTLAGTKNGSPLCVNDFLLVLSDNGKLQLLDASPERHDPLAEARPFREGRCWTMPALADGFLIVRNESQMKCYDLRKHHKSDEESSRGK